MRTIPIATAGVLLAGRPQLAAHLRPFGRAVGLRVEVDLEAAGVDHPSLCQALSAYQWQTQELWRAVATGRAAGVPYVLTRRALADNVQVTSKAGRADLREAFDALHELAVTRDVMAAATSLQRDLEAVDGAVGAVGGTLEEPEAGWLVITVPLQGAAAWPWVLGGPATATEVARWARITVRHAKGRDRALRTLARVEVLIDELWADPQQARELLPAA